MSVPIDKIKVLHIITNMPIGGAQDNTLSTIEGLDKERYDISLMSGPKGDWKERAQRIEGCRCIFINEMVREVHLIKDFIAFVKIFIALRRGKYDIVHTHSSKPGFYGRFAARLASVPVIIHTIHGFPFHDFMPKIFRQFLIILERFLSGISDKLITVSKLNLQQALGLNLALPEKFVNVYSGIDFSKFNKKVDLKKKRRELNIPNNTKVVGFVGRLTKCKGIEYFFRAVQTVTKQSNGIVVLIVGDGELRWKSERLAEELGITPFVKFLGFREDVPELLQLFDVYVLSSLWEGLGRALTEALYSRRPTVATAVAGVPELVRNKETGILVPPADPAALAEGILYLLDNPDKRKKLAQNAHNLVKQEFSVEAMVQSIDELYQELYQSNKLL
jgi:glycosyltransferase involved in cell wall biosynthesis